MSDVAEQLKAFEPTQEFFVGIDSDGCASRCAAVAGCDAFIGVIFSHFLLYREANA